MPNVHKIQNNISSDTKELVDFNLVDNLGDLMQNQSPFVYTETDIIFQEIEMLLSTSPYDVLNANDEFLNLKAYIFKTNVSNTSIKQKLERLISDTVFIPDNIHIDLDVYFLHGTVSDIGIIDVHIENTSENDVQNRLYSFA